MISSFENNKTDDKISSAPGVISDTVPSLDEPISETITRDLRMIVVKLSHVLLPRGSTKELRDWDLWGPLLLCLVLGLSLSFSATNDQSALVFATVFVLVWCGSAIVTLNAALLGGNISFFQSVCVLGYCIAPLVISSLFCHLWSNKIYQGFLCLFALFWSVRASLSFMAQLVPENRKALGVYPVLLFYIAITLMILVQ